MGTPSESGEVGVLVIDDQDVFRRAVRGMLGASVGFRVVGEAESGEEGVELAAELAPDMALIDLRMPGMDGIETARRIAGRGVEALLVLISVDASPRVELSALPPEIAAFVPKQGLTAGAVRDIWKAHRRAGG